MNPVGAILIAVLSLMILMAGRKTAALALMAGVMFVPMAQHLDLAGFNLFSMRIFGVLAFLRVVGRGEFSFANRNAVDKALLWVQFFGMVVYCVRSRDGFAYVIGTSLDLIFAYFACRGLIQDMEEWNSFLKSLTWMLATAAVLAGVEMATRRNPFSIIGGKNFGWLRAGRLRCFGAFQNPDLLGSLGATFLPLYFAQAWVKENRRLAGLAIASCLFLVFACNSGGPLSALGMGLVAWWFWRYRTKMQMVRRALAWFLIATALAMKAPIWYLIARVSSITGGDGWHRSYLMDVTFKHIGEWWLVGMPIAETADWMPTTLATTGGADICNQYVANLIRAGLGMLCIFILMLVRSYNLLGRAMDSIRSVTEWVTAEEVMFWALGVMLTTHITNWFGITYFDQSYAMWCLQMAAISTLCQRAIDNPPQVDSLDATGNNTETEIVPAAEYQPLT